MVWIIMMIFYYMRRAVFYIYTCNAYIDSSWHRHLTLKGPPRKAGRWACRSWLMRKRMSGASESCCSSWLTRGPLHIPPWTSVAMRYGVTHGTSVLHAFELLIRVFTAWFDLNFCRWLPSFVAVCGPIWLVNRLPVEQLSSCDPPSHIHLYSLIFYPLVSLTCTSIILSVCSSTWLPVCLSVCLSVCLTTCLSARK